VPINKAFNQEFEYSFELDESEEDSKKENKELPKMKKPKLYKICGVELFKAGFHNGKEYSEQDIDEIINNFSGLKKENPNFKLPIKIGHKMKDGAPAIGWFENLRKVSGKLVCDFVDVAEPVAKFINLNGLKNRSIEMYENFVNSAGEKVGKVLKAVALLGDTMPAVNLSDIQELNELGKAIYGSAFEGEQDYISIKFSDIKEDKEMLPEKKEVESKDETQEFKKEEFKKEEFKKAEQPVRKSENEEIKEIVNKFSKNPEEVLKTLSEFKKTESEYKQFMLNYVDEKKKEKEAKIKEFTSNLIKENKIYSAEKNIVETLLSSANDFSEIEFSYSEFDVIKKSTNFEILKDFLSKLPDRGLLNRESSDSVNFDYNTAVLAFSKKLGFQNIGRQEDLSVSQFKQVISAMANDPKASKFVNKK